MSDTTLEARVQRLEDIQAITTLTATYAHYVDTGWNGKKGDFDQLPSVFAPDATWRSAAMNADATGVDAIVELLRGAGAGFEFAMHSFTNPMITVDGDTASASWLLWVGVRGGGVANEVFQSEDLEYVRTTDGWRIQAIDLHFGQMLHS